MLPAIERMVNKSPDTTKNSLLDELELDSDEATYAHTR